MLIIKEPASKKGWDIVFDRLSPEGRRLSEMREKALHDEVSMIAGARDEGIEIGVIKVAKNILRANADVSFISQVTNLSESEIKKIQAELAEDLH